MNKYFNSVALPVKISDCEKATYIFNSFHTIAKSGCF